MVQREYIDHNCTELSVWSSDMPIEYLRGTAETDACENLFKQYKSCLSVCSGLPTSIQWLIVPRLHSRNAVSTRCSKRPGQITRRMTSSIYGRAPADTVFIGTPGETTEIRSFRFSYMHSAGVWPFITLPHSVRLARAAEL